MHESAQTVTLRLALVLLVCAACTGLQETPALIKGRLVLDTDPNPLVARQVGDDLYELAFAIVMREEGGVDVRIEGFTVEAIAFKTVVVQSQTYPASYITDRGYPAAVAAGQYLRFDFVKRWPLPTRLLLSGAAVRVTARTIDAQGRRDVSVVKIPVRVNG
jgi:hypothetical protein